MKIEEYAIFFDNGAWVVLRQDQYGNIVMREVAPSLEEAIMAVSLLTGSMVGLKLISRQP